MKELKDILTVRIKSGDVLVLEVKPDSQVDLIMNGFNGNERMFRLLVERTGGMYGDNKYYTPFFDNGTIIEKGATFEWGGTSTTCVSDEFRRQRDMVVAVARELGFEI